MKTKDELARELYPDTPYDCALPQRWVDEVTNKYGFDPRPCVVWGYPPRHTVMGKPLPLNDHARTELAKLPQQLSW